MRTVPIRDEFKAERKQTRAAEELLSENEIRYVSSRVNSS